MKKYLVHFIFVSLIIFSSCKNEKKAAHWSYEGESSPEHWTEIEKNSDCDGKSQSPINIIVDHTVAVNKADQLQVFYSPETELSTVKNNGHSLQFDFEEGDSIHYKKETYHLKQLHFHEPAEHLVNGIRYPIEIHFVHKSDKDHLTVLSVFGEEGDTSDLTRLLKTFLPIESGASKNINYPIDLSSLYPKGNRFYSYSGSLTTPPCSENVNWVIFKDQIILSYEQVLNLKETMPLNNYRNEQPLNERIVYLNQ